MAIYQVCSSVITGAVLASTTILAVSCRPTAHTGTHSASAANNAAEATGQSIDPTATTAKSSPIEKKAVNTNHDIYHSKAIEVPAGTEVPAITVRVDTDAIRGWNLYVGTANFTFTPSDVNGESRPTEGHAHLYINDKSVQRIYGAWTHLPELPAGKNEIRVTLNANGHETLTTQGSPIEDAVTVEVYAPENASENTPENAETQAQHNH